MGCCSVRGSQPVGMSTNRLRSARKTVRSCCGCDPRGFEQQRRRPLPAADTGRSCWGSILIFQSPAKGLRKNQQTQPARPCRTVPQAISPVGCCLARGSRTRRNVYREDCRSNRKSELFLDRRGVRIFCFLWKREQWSELDYLIYNDPLGYADLILNGDPEEYLKNVAGSHGLEI